MGKHSVPRQYLRGFCDDQGWIFQYTHGESEPIGTGVERVAQAKGFYSDEIEKTLTEIENRANPLLTQLRKKQLIAAEDKITLAEYIISLMKRTSKGFERTRKRAPQIVDFGFSNAEEYLKYRISVQPHKRHDLEREWEKLNRHKDEWKRNLPREIWYSVLRPKTTPKSVEALSKLVWVFYVADCPSFLTSDNPVFYPEDRGIARANSIVSFPISSTIALEATNELHQMGFYEASQRRIDEINRRTVQNATRHVFHRERAQWVLDLMSQTK